MDDDGSQKALICEVYHADPALYGGLSGPGLVNRYPCGILMIGAVSSKIQASQQKKAMAHGCVMICGIWWICLAHGKLQGLQKGSFPLSRDEICPGTMTPTPSGARVADSESS